MRLSLDDEFVLKLTAWRENRGGGIEGMQSVMNAIVNRAVKERSTVYNVCTAPEQFSSMTVLGDAGTVRWAKEGNSASWQTWQEADRLAAAAQADRLEDLTGGATLYYAPAALAPENRAAVDYRLPAGDTVPFPKGWDRTKVKFTRQVAGQLFFVEL